MGNMRIISLLIFSFLFTAAQSQITENIANQVIQNVSNKLNGLQSISYDLKRELNYSSEDYRVTSEWHEYLEFLNIGPLNFKYQIKDVSGKQIFNGTEKFDLEYKTKSIQMDDHPTRESFENVSAFYNSIFTLRNILPEIISDKSVTTLRDTTFDNKLNYVITISVGKRRIKNSGNGFDAVKFNSVYKIIIDKVLYLPLEILQSINKTDFIKTSFLNINANPEPPSEYSWFYSTYTKEYKPAIKKDMPELIPVGSIAPDWTLSLYNKNENISLSKLKGNMVLLDFWFKNCGGCIESVPHLNSIRNKFKNQKFEILGINIYDTQKEISLFCNRHKTEYKVLMNGKVVAEKYGAFEYPTVILIDKNGIVIYSGNFIESKIEDLITAAL